jgi:protein required for attachment to host cells
MATTWVLVAHDAGARVFENHGPGKGLTLVEETDHPEGRMRDGELVSDRPGRSFRKDSGDPRRAAMSQSQGPHDRVVASFARDLAQRLQQGRMQSMYDRLVLVAPPKFLGLLRSSLDAPTGQLVVGSLDKDLARSNEAELVEHLGEIIAV